MLFHESKTSKVTSLKDANFHPLANLFTICWKRNAETCSPLQIAIGACNSILYVLQKKSRNGDTLGPVELNVGLEQGNQGDQGDQREQDDQGEVSIIIFGMSESLGFQKYSANLCLCHCLCICVL